MKKFFFFAFFSFATFEKIDLKDDWLVIKSN